MTSTAADLPLAEAQPEQESRTFLLDSETHEEAPRPLALDQASA